MDAGSDQETGKERKDQKKPEKYDSDDEFEPEDNQTPLVHKQTLRAAENGNLQQLTQLINEDNELTNCSDADGYTPLHRAAYNGHVDCCKLLIASGAAVDARTGDGWTPLHSAGKYAQGLSVFTSWLNAL